MGEQFKPAGQPVAELNSRKIERQLQQLRKAEVWIDATIDELVEQIQRDCQFTHYNVGRLATLLETEPLLTHRDQIIAAIDHTTGRLNEETLKLICKKLGKDNQLLIQALVNSEIKEV